VADSHSAFDIYVPEAPLAIIGNLGYLPGGDPAITTSTEST
jgi:hypothetical protein